MPCSAEPYCQLQGCSSPTRALCESSDLAQMPCIRGGAGIPAVCSTPEVEVSIFMPCGGTRDLSTHSSPLLPCSVYVFSPSEVSPSWGPGLRLRVPALACSLSISW